MIDKALWELSAAVIDLECKCHVLRKFPSSSIQNQVDNKFNFKQLQHSQMKDGFGILLNLQLSTWYPLHVESFTRPKLEYKARGEGV